MGKESKRRWQIFYLLLAAGLNLNFSSMFQYKPLNFTFEATPNLEIMTNGAFHALNHNFINMLNKKIQSATLVVPALPSDLMPLSD